MNLITALQFFILGVLCLGGAFVAYAYLREFKGLWIIIPIIGVVTPTFLSYLSFKVSRGFWRKFKAGR